MFKFKELCEQIEKQKQEWLTELKDVLAINNSLNHQKHEDQATMIQWLVQKLCQFNAVVEIIENETIEGDLVTPKLILAYIKQSQAKQTLLIYGHIDTKEPSKGLHSRLFDLMCVDGKMCGHGIAHSKGPLLCWIHALEALQLAKQKLAVNIKFIIETHRTADSAQMEHLMRMRERFFQHINYVSLLERTNMATKELPVVCSSSPGSVHFVVELDRIQGQDTTSKPRVPKSRLTLTRHSSKPVKQPLDELVQLLDALTDEFGKLHLPKDALRSEIVGDVGSSKREPRLTMHEVKGDFTNSSSAKLVPPHVTGKFCIEFGPAYNGRSISDYICCKLHRIYRKMSGANTLILTAKRLMPPCQLKRDASVNLKTLESALAYIGNDAIYFASSHRPHYVGYLLHEFTKCEVLIFNLFSPPEKIEPNDEVMEYIDESAYWNGVKQLAAYIWCLGTNQQNSKDKH